MTNRRHLKTALTALVLVSATLPGAAQVPDVLWKAPFGSSSGGSASRVLVLANGDTVVLGVSGGCWTNSAQAVGLNAQGNERWAQAYSYPPTEQGYSSYQAIADACIINGNEIVVTGWRFVSVKRKNDIWIARLNSRGDTLRNYTEGDTMYDRGRVVKPLPDGGFVVAGVQETVAGYEDGVILRYGADGNAVWKRTFGSPNADGIADIEIAANGDVVFVGYTSPLAPAKRRLWVGEVDQNGAPLWDRSFGDTCYQEGAAVELMPDGSIMVMGTRQSEVPRDGYDPLLMKVSANGDSLWTRVLADTQSTEGTDLALDSKGNLFATWSQKFGCPNEGAETKQITLASLSPDGKVLWRGGFPGSGGNLTVLSDKRLFVGGSIAVGGYFQACAFLVAVNDPPVFADSVVTRVVSEFETYRDSLPASDDFSFDTVTYRLVSSPNPDLRLDTKTAAITWPLKDSTAGVYDLSLVATDRMGQSDTLRIRLTVNNVNTPVRILSLRPSPLVAVAPGSSVSLSAILSNKDNDSIQYRWDYLGETVGSGSVLQFTPRVDAAVDTHFVKLRVSDGLFADSAMWRIVLDTAQIARPAPLLISPKNGSQNAAVSALVWSEIPDPEIVADTLYRVEIARDVDFRNVVARVDSFAGTEILLSSLAAHRENSIPFDTLLFWRVKSFGGNFSSAYSPPWWFILPQPATPAVATETGKPPEKFGIVQRGDGVGVVIPRSTAKGETVFSVEVCNMKGQILSSSSHPLGDRTFYRVALAERFSGLTIVRVRCGAHRTIKILR